MQRQDYTFAHLLEMNNDEKQTKKQQSIIRLQGDHEGKGYPFNKNGKGNEGYLFNLNKSLAKFFMEEIIKCNSFMKEKDYVREILQ